ncbi:AimR family lysis-lysogeny pheromone receptor [Lentibacillus sp. Marseille-P4043]|uniref:AimR family lysis-lysogeny pheromone receptor n=1 Tax=Lentibacillus sp. Marseille-P4043 TaxID=2040293 RepID=UPI000D0B206F|nr:AimR family lysis-lysogeny pheromone receptor [Lentibacillus sp. Marseille-P4043]
MEFPKADLAANSLISVSYDGKLSLEQVILMLQQEHDDETVLQLTRKFCLQTTSDEISKKGMEFLYINGYFEDLQQLIDKNRESEYKSNREWAEVYQLVVNRRRQRIQTSRELLRQLSFYKTGDPELSCVTEFLKIAIHFDLKEFGKIGNSLDKLSSLFDAVEDSLLLSYFHLRLYQNLFIYYWTRNELIMARKYAFRVLNKTTNNKTKVNMHINLGLTYTFDTYFQGMYHFSEALKLAKKYHFNDSIHVVEQQNIPFLSAHFNKFEGIKTDIKSEQAHLEIAKGNYTKAITILNQIPMDSPFKLYYLGVAKQDKDILLQSYNYFIGKRSDYFFSKLPLNQIVKMDNTPMKFR